MAYSTPASLSSGNTLSAAHMNQIRSNEEDIAKPPIAWATKSASQSIPNATLTTVTWAATTILRNFTLGSNKLTPGETGLFQINVVIPWAANSSGHRGLRIVNNGAMIHESHLLPISAGTKQTVSAFISADTNDLIEVQAYQDSGGALNIDAGFASFQAFMISRI